MPRHVAILFLGASFARAQPAELRDPRTKGLLVLQHDQILYQLNADRPHYTASLAKALVGGMSLLVALEDGHIQVDDPACTYIPAWRQDPVKRRITIRQLATHSSGIEDAEQDGKPHTDLPGWKGAFWRREPDPFSIAIHQAPVVFEPGTRYAYSNPGMAALAYALTAATRTDLRTLLRDRVFSPLGIADREWSIGYDRAYELDGLRLFAAWGGGSFTPRAVARVGRFMLQGKSPWIARVTAPAGTPLPDHAREPFAPASGLCWYTNVDGIWPLAPRDAFAGAGAGHQLLLVIPSLDLVAVRNGDSFGSEFWTAAYRNFFEPLMRAVHPVSIEFAPAESIVRDAVDSDNWPLTWADDDALYTSYGDGWGFEPRTDRKLSLGFARITGPATAFHGVNIRTRSGERTGDGKAGAKASGVLMVDGVLYMWARNLGNSQLAWSDDHARTWHWGFRFETSFGSPSFLNFGRNYQGARDRYVYVYSQDGPSAYASDDRVILARVPQDRIRDRAAWEFFASDGVWTRDIAQRGAVVTYSAHCQRIDVVYNPGLKRYLLALGYNHNGGWGIFDAPEPWGPWTVAFHTEGWGLGGTHGYRLPSKWISGDGKEMYLVFSGVKPNDAFCVRRLTIH